jgi:hypothetical protein
VNNKHFQKLRCDVVHNLVVLYLAMKNKLYSIWNEVFEIHVMATWLLQVNNSFKCSMAKDIINLKKIRLCQQYECHLTEINDN